MSPTWNMSKATALLALVVCLACCVSCLPLEGLDKPDYFTVQTRSSGPGRSTRFYQGTRYGGKRSYWHPFLSAESEVANDGNGGSAERSLSRRDCLYLSLIGVRCERSNDAASHQANPGAEARIPVGYQGSRDNAQPEAVLE